MTHRRWKKEPMRLVPRKEMPKPLEGLDALRDLDSRDTRAEFLQAIEDRLLMVRAGQLKPLGLFDPAVAGVTLPLIASRMGSGAATDRGWMPATQSNSVKSKPASRFVPESTGARVYNDGLDDLGTDMIGAGISSPSNSTIRDILDNRF